MKNQTRISTRRRISKKPLVSVIMPVYNAEKYLEEAILSILNQSYKKFEFIIVDDASTDNSPSIIQRYAKKYPTKIRPIFLKNNLNRGGDACANTGLKIANGELIARMDADDIALPNRLAVQVAYLQNNADTFLIGSQAIIIDSDGNELGMKLVPNEYKNILQESFNFNPIIHPSVMFRSHVRNGEKFSYEIKYSANNDFYTFFKMEAEGYIFENLESNLMKIRMHDRNDTFNNIRQKFINTLSIRKEVSQQFGVKPTHVQYLITIIQALVVLMMPNYIVRKAYLTSRKLTILLKNIHTLTVSKIRINNFALDVE